MSKIFNDLILELNDNLDEKVQELSPHYSEYRILKQSVDARSKKSPPKLVYTVEVASSHEQLDRSEWHFEKISHPNIKPIIIGTGPAGLFCALRLMERGIPSLIFERGSIAEERMKGINRFWRYGLIDRRNNVCFGEGGAGLYSDGKLITRIKSPHIPYVLRRLVDFGAPAEIEFLSNPHVGSDRLRRVIPHIRKHLVQSGCKFFFNTQVTQIKVNAQKQVTGIATEWGNEFHSPFVIVATGHSAEDMLQHLNDIEVKLEGKSFAVGLRIEHAQEEINRIQYRDFAKHPKLGSANYKLTYHKKNENIGVYSFCMCPGGYVLSSGTEEGGIVCNGMSNYKRNSLWANSALVVTIDHEAHFKNQLLGGLNFRRELEASAKKMVIQNGGTKQLPSQKLIDFLDGRKSRDLNPSSSPSGATSARLDLLLPPFLKESLIEGISEFNKNMRGFISPQAQLYAIESRTSCPLRVVRDPLTYQSLTHKGLYPAGEGAGYAGGITSAACDGVNIADAISNQLSNTSTK